jgi:cobalt-zinc-cadmium efflux system protein
MTGHRHGPGGHSDSAAGPRNSRYLAGAFALILAFMATEVVVGIIASSLALISDAGHMLTDAAAIALVLIAARLAARPAAGNLTSGWKRVEILSAQANGITCGSLPPGLSTRPSGGCFTRRRWPAGSF